VAKVARFIGTVAGVLSTVLQFVPGAQPIAFGLKAAQLATAAAVVAVAAGTVATLAAKKPGAQGQINGRIIGANNPQPYMIGRSYSGGIQVHEVGYGGRIDKVDNPYRFIAVVYSCCGPVEGLENVLLDYTPVTFSGTSASGYYSGWFWRDYQLGARPEADALSPQFSGAPDWGSDYKLSSFAAIGYSLKWDKDGKRFPGGQMPTIGAVWEGVKVYDPRLDTTYPGGSGAHRIADENTWEYSRNPALHALAYAYGRYVNGEKVFGVDLGADAIDVAAIVAWANVCDANDWFVDGTIYEPDDKWNNLKRICEAGGGEPVMIGGLLSFDYQSPRTSLATITRDDLAGGNVGASLGKGWKERHNTLVPRYRSENHQWNFVQAGAIDITAAVTADGEIKQDERQWDLVTGVDQVAQLATYDLHQRREAGPFTFTGKPHLLGYDPGDCLTLDEELGAHPDGAIKVVVRKRTLDPISGAVAFECEAETDAKHTAALAAVGVPPSAGPALPTSGQLDGVPNEDLTADTTILTADSSFYKADAT
jgi:hypothetical protein